jgi:hypothetical protein
MVRTCLKCGFEGDANDDPMAACSNCGAIFSKVQEARDRAIAEQRAAEQRSADLAAKAKQAAERAEVKQRTQQALLAQRQQMEQRAEMFAIEQRSAKPRRWFTPQFALFIYIALAALFVLPAMIASFLAGPLGLLGVAAGIAVLLLGGVLMELILVVFHIATALDDCRAMLRQISTRTGSDGG